MCPLTGSLLKSKVHKLQMQHIGALVNAIDPHTQKIRTTRVNDLVDLFLIRHVLLRMETSAEQIDSVYVTSNIDRKVQFALNSVLLTFSPTILFDTRELLYLPFCARVLHIPIDPICVLNLT